MRQGLTQKSSGKTSSESIIVHQVRTMRCEPLPHINTQGKFKNKIVILIFSSSFSEWYAFSDKLLCNKHFHRAIRPNTKNTLVTHLCRVWCFDCWQNSSVWSRQPRSGGNFASYSRFWLSFHDIQQGAVGIETFRIICIKLIFGSTIILWLTFIASGANVRTVIDKRRFS